MTCFFDSHAHLTELPELSPEEPGQIAEAGGIIGAAASVQDWEKLRPWGRLPNVQLAIGIHPVGISTAPPLSHLDQLMEEFCLSAEHIAAVGEIGLDYAVCPIHPDIQREYFILQMDFALRHDLAVILHIRKAWNDFFTVMKNHPRFAGLRIVYHNASCSLEIARQLQHFPNLYFSFSGTVTWPAAGKIHKLAAAVPENRLLTDSDSPYLPPQGYESSRPWTVLENLSALASIRNCSIEKMASAVRNNYLAVALKQH